LDKVKPLRNDLSDSDLELVAAVKQPEPAQKAVTVESEEIQVVKARTMVARVLALLQRRN
jgi:hypothetical protein